MRPFFVISVMLLSTFVALGQDKNEYAAQLKAIEEEMDSLSIFTLIDSLFSLDLSIHSELNVRVGYTTNVTSAGRNYNISQSAFSPGIAYYHKSGTYFDLTGYWNSGVEPNYNPTILSMGYLGEFQNTKWNYSLDAERWFYNPKDSSENSLFYSIGGSLSYDFKWGFATADYSFLFGNETAHRVITNLSGTISLGKWWVFKNISLYPSASMMVGNNNITQLRITTHTIRQQYAERLTSLESFKRLTPEQQKFIFTLTIRSYRNGIITEEQRNSLLIDLHNRNTLSPTSRQALFEIASQSYQIETLEESSRFGILNYAFTLPLSLSTDRLYIMLSYTYSIPVQLPGEFIQVDPIGYFGASITYRIPFK